MVSRIWQIYSEIKMKKIYIFITLPLPHSFGPGMFALNSHSYNPLFEKILDPPLKFHIRVIFYWYLYLPVCV